MTTVLGKWDKGVEYNIAKLKLSEQLDSLAKMLSINDDNKSLAKKFIYTAVAYLQLVNGSRIQEAITGLQLWLRTNKTEFQIIAGKTHVERDFIIPNEVQRYLFLFRRWEALVFSLRKHNIIMWLKKHFGWNSHSLRYAFIRKAIERGYSASQIAIILGHKKIDTTLNYARRINAIEILKKMQID